MGTLYVFVIAVTLSTHCSAYVVSHSEPDKSTASVLLKEGQSAEISCMTRGTGDFFWRKGETLYTSTLVASFTVGEVSDDSQPYSVTANGTLHIRSVTLKDEGNYFCRISSTENECHGEVKILVQASLRIFDLAIDRCDRESSCLLYLNPSEFTSLTCTAVNAPPLMTLKWFNGSKEITKGIEQNEILPQNGNSREITSTLAAVYGHPASLTCQAVDPKRSNDDIRFAHAQVEMTVPAYETLPSLIIVAVTLAGCFIFFGIYLLIKARANRKKRKKYKEEKTEEAQSLMGDVESKAKEIADLETKLKQRDEEIKKAKEQNFELQQSVANNKAKMTAAEELAKTKDQEIKNKNQELTDLKSKVPDQIQERSTLKGDVQSKAKAIAELETKLKQRDEEIKKEKEQNFELQKTIANNEAKITAAKELAKTKDQEIKNKNQELTDLKLKVPDQIQEMSKLKEDVRSKAKAIADLDSKLKQKEAEVKERFNEIIELQKINSDAFANEKSRTTVAKELMQTKANEITELKETVKQKDKEISDQRENVLYCQTNLHRKEIDLQRKSDDISKLQSDLKEKQDEIENLQTELAKLKEDVQSKPKRTVDLETKLRKRDEEIKVANNKIVKLQGALLEKERELNLAKHPKGAQNGSQQKPGKKH